MWLKLIFLFHSFVKVVVRPTLLFKLTIETIDLLRLLTGQIPGGVSDAETFDGSFDCYFICHIGCSCFEVYKSLIII